MKNKENTERVTKTRTGMTKDVRPFGSKKKNVDQGNMILENVTVKNKIFKNRSKI